MGSCDCSPQDIHIYRADTIPQSNSLPIHFQNSLLRIKQLSLDVKSCPTLNLKATSPYFQDELLKITPQGLGSSLRNRKDGITFFGNKPAKMDFNLHGNYPGILFHIEFNPLLKQYLLKAHSPTVKVRKKVVCLFPGLELQMGRTLFRVGQRHQSLDMQIVDTGKSFVLENGVTIGRGECCSISVADESMSKVHGEVQKRIDWMMMDHSKNGIWAHTSEHKLKEGSRIRSSDWQFQVQFQKA